MKWHLIEGAPGCSYAVEHNCVAVVVDSLRASATAAMLLDAGASEIIAVREVDDAHAARRAHADALLFGERGGLPPEGFDFGNSPRTVAAAKGRRVIFTTTTGAGRLVACWGAAAVYMGGPLNASAVARAAASHGKDVVLIPAGLMDEPDFDAREDWAGAALIAMMAQATVAYGRGRFEHWRSRIDTEGLPGLFNTAPHAGKLRNVGLEDDIEFCARIDLTGAVPQVTAKSDFGVIVHDARAVDIR